MVWYFATSYGEEQPPKGTIYYYYIDIDEDGLIGKGISHGELI